MGTCFSEDKTVNIEDEFEDEAMPAKGNTHLQMPQNSSETFARSRVATGSQWVNGPSAKTTFTSNNSSKFTNNTHSAAVGPYVHKQQPPTNLQAHQQNVPPNNAQAFPPKHKRGYQQVPDHSPPTNASYLQSVVDNKPHGQTFPNASHRNPYNKHQQKKSSLPDRGAPQFKEPKWFTPKATSRNPNKYDGNQRNMNKKQYNSNPSQQQHKTSLPKVKPVPKPKNVSGFVLPASIFNPGASNAPINNNNNNSRNQSNNNHSNKRNSNKTDARYNNNNNNNNWNKNENNNNNHKRNGNNTGANNNNNQWKNNSNNRNNKQWNNNSNNHQHNNNNNHVQERNSNNNNNQQWNNNKNNNKNNKQWHNSNHQNNNNQNQRNNNANQRNNNQNQRNNNKNQRNNNSQQNNNNQRNNNNEYKQHQQNSNNQNKRSHKSQNANKNANEWQSVQTKPVAHNNNNAHVQKQPQNQWQSVQNKPVTHNNAPVQQQQQPRKAPIKYPSRPKAGGDMISRPPTRKQRQQRRQQKKVVSKPAPIKPQHTRQKTAAEQVFDVNENDYDSDDTAEWRKKSVLQNMNQRKSFINYKADVSAPPKRAQKATNWDEERRQSVFEESSSSGDEPDIGGRRLTVNISHAKNHSVSSFVNLNQ